MQREHHRRKRFLFNENTIKNGSSSRTIKGYVLEQMIANTLQDVNFTAVAVSILNNNEAMDKLRTNIDNEALIRMVLREVNYEKLGRGLWFAIQNQVDLEHFVANIINTTHIDEIHDEMFINGSLPAWLLKHFHPDLNIKIITRVFLTLKNFTQKFVRILSKPERFDTYLFNMITQQVLTPLSSIIKGVNESKPKGFEQLLELIVNNVYTVATEQITTYTQRTITKLSEETLVTSTTATVDLDDNDHVKWMLYQWSIALDSMGKITRIIFKALEKLYCTSL